MKYRLEPLLLLGFIVTFVTGMFGDAPEAAPFVAIGTFLPACGFGGTWWTWPILALSAWGAGVGVVEVLRLVSPTNFPDAPNQLNTMLTVVAAFTSGLVGTSLHWAASRITRAR